MGGRGGAPLGEDAARVLGAAGLALGALWPLAPALGSVGFLAWLAAAHSLAIHYGERRVLDGSAFAAAAALLGAAVSANVHVNVKLVGSFLVLWPFAVFLGLFASDALQRVARRAGLHDLEDAARLVLYGGLSLGVLVGAALMAVGLVLAAVSLAPRGAGGGGGG